MEMTHRCVIGVWKDVVKRKLERLMKGLRGLELDKKVIFLLFSH